jgi:hypothetical protein
MAVEQNDLRAPGINWSPDAGLLMTEVRWKTDMKMSGIALFHWPWLVRPTVSEVLELEIFAKHMKERFGGITDRVQLPEDFVLRWLNQSFLWQSARSSFSAPLPEISRVEELTAVVDQIERLVGVALEDGGALANSMREKSAALREEIRRWIGELTVMTAPYFGLPDDLANRLYEAISKCKIWTKEWSKENLRKEQRRTVEDAFHAWNHQGSRQKHNSADSGGSLTSDQVKQAVDEFLADRERLAPDSEWWKRVSIDDDKSKLPHSPSPETSGGSGQTW